MQALVLGYREAALTFLELLGTLSELDHIHKKSAAILEACEIKDEELFDGMDVEKITCTSPKSSTTSGKPTKKAAQYNRNYAPRPEEDGQEEAQTRDDVNTRGGIRGQSTEHEDSNARDKLADTGRVSSGKKEGAQRESHSDNPNYNDNSSITPNSGRLTQSRREIINIPGCSLRRAEERLYTGPMPPCEQCHDDGTSAKECAGLTFHTAEDESRDSQRDDTDVGKGINIRAEKHTRDLNAVLKKESLEETKDEKYELLEREGDENEEDGEGVMN